MIRPFHLCVLVASATLAIPAISAARTCRDAQVPQSQWRERGMARTLEQHLDFDQDGKDDTLITTMGLGSGTGGASSTTVLTRTGHEHTVEMELSFYDMVQHIPVPIELLEPQHESLRHAMEDALFERTCDAPEASLRRLLSPDAPLEWVKGRPGVPDYYTVLDRSASPPEWITYKGHMHEALQRADANDSYRLFRTNHGVVLTDAAQTKHAWLYVFPGRNRKLRFASIKSATLDGHVVEITLAQEKWVEVDAATDGRAVETGHVRVDLTTGKTTTRWE